MVVCKSKEKYDGHVQIYDINMMVVCKSAEKHDGRMHIYERTEVVCKCIEKYMVVCKSLRKYDGGIQNSWKI